MSDRHITCLKCGTALHEFDPPMTSESDPCPICGASPVDRRWDLFDRDHFEMTDSVKVTLTTSAGDVHVSGSGDISTTGHAQHFVDAEISPPEVAKEVHERVTEIAYGIRIQPHTEDAPGWFVQLVNAEGEVLGSAFGDNATDAALSAALELERDLQGAAEPPSPDADL